MPPVMSESDQSPAPERVYALRGAVQADRNERAAILSATDELLREMIARNGIEPNHIVSCILTCTADLDAEFPAVAARELGLHEVPLLCTREIDVPGSMERVIRAMVHYYGPAKHSPAHVYLGEAQKLRSDLHSAQ
jgi:chorismate mutase